MSKQRSYKPNEETLAYPTLEAVARASKLSTATIRGHLDEIAHRRVGRRIVITKAALQRWLEGHDKEEVK